MDVEHLFKQRSGSFHRRVLAMTVIVGVVMALLIYSSYRLGQQMIERYTPLMDAVMELQIHATTSHLWFEEILSDDRNEDMGAVYHHLDLADKYAELMITGGVFEAVAYEPLQDHRMLAQLNMVRDKLSRYREIMEKRWEMRDSSGPGSELDQTFDAIFNELISEADALEIDLQVIIREAMEQFYLNNMLLLFLAVVITFSVGWGVRRFMLRQAYGVHLLERANLELAAEVEKRKRTEALLEKQASTDHLTGIMNRNRMSEMLLEEWLRTARYSERFSLILFDIDHFKRVNDKLGHQAGDRALVELTHRIGHELRDIDAFARWGGEEFLIMLPKTDLHGAREVAERCRQALASTPIKGVGTVTASFGVVVSSETDDTLQQLLQRADEALYEAKRVGRDCVRTEKKSP